MKGLGEKKLKEERWETRLKGKSPKKSTTNTKRGKLESVRKLISQSDA